MHELLARQLAADYCCAIADILDARHHFTIFQPRPDRRQYEEILPCILKIAVANGKLLFTGREDVIARCRELYAGANAEWFMEPRGLQVLRRELASFGAKIRRMRPYYTCSQAVPVQTEGFRIIRYTPEEIEQFRGIDRYGHAYGFCPEAPDVLGAAAVRDGEIIGMAGASADSPYLWQIGIDVEPHAQGQGVASALVGTIRNDILQAGRLPYYSTSISHMASQRVALKCGFLPAWFELAAIAE